MLENNSLPEQVRRRALQLQIAEVSRAASSILDLEELLPRVVDLIREQFDLYYVGLFLVEEIPQGRGGVGRWAVLRAGTGEAGQKMIQAGHKLAVGGESMIGRCMASGQAHIALDVGKEAVRFDNPLLPLTRSEMALPLISRGRIIGAMTIQSAQPAAFSDEDITVLQTMADQLANAIENAYLFQERERRITELAIVNEIGQVLSTALELDELLAAVHQQVSRLFDTTNFYIATYKEGDDHWSTAFHLEHGQRQPPARYSVAAGLTGHIIRTRQPILLHSVAENIAFHQALGREMIGEIARSWLGVPLLTADKLVGVMAIQNYEQEFLYTDQDLALFSTVAAQVANALDNQRLLAETRRRAREMEVINEIGQAITSVLDPDAVLRQIVDTIKERFGYFFVGILLVEGNQLVFRSGSFVGNSATRWERGDIRLDLNSQSLNAAVVTGGQPVLVNDVRSDPRYQVAEGLEPVRAELDVPIVVKGQIIGTLTVQSDRPNSFDQTDVRLLQALANQAGVAIENARLFQEAQRQVTRTQILLEVGEAITSTLESVEVTRRIARAAARALGADTASVYVLDETGKWLQPVAGYHVPPALLERYRQTPLSVEDHPFIQGAIENRRMMFSHDVPHDLADDPAFPQLLPARSMLLTPMIVKGQVIGALWAVWWEKAHLLTHEEQGLVEGLVHQAAVAIENTRLFEQTQTALAQTTSLYEASQAITVARDRQEVVDALVEQIDHTGLDRVVVALIVGMAEDQPLVEVQGVWDRAGEQRPGRRFTPAQLPLLAKAGPRDILLVYDVTTSTEIDEVSRATFLYLGLKSMAVLPISAGERLLGWLLLETTAAPRRFTEEEIRPYITLASQAAVALQNLSRLQEIQARAEQERASRAMLALRVRELDCLNDIGRKMDETPPVPDFLQWATERIPAAMQYPELCRAAIEYEGRVYGAAEAVRLPRQMVQQMRIGGQAVGRVYVAYTQDYDFLDEESALLGDLTRRVSGYIENRRLFEQIQARAERERRLRTITDRIWRGTDMSSILRIGLEELSQMLGTSQLIVRLGSQEQLRAWAPDLMPETGPIHQDAEVRPGPDDGSDREKKGEKPSQKPKH